MADNDRAVRFELHIRPLMRLLDRDQMLFRFDLWDYDQVRANADRILTRLRIDMPPARNGGPWPPEWISLFERWLNTGFLRLELGRSDANGYQATRSGTNVTINAMSSVPSQGYQAWLELQVAEADRREYLLYWEPPVTPQPPNPTLARVRTRFAAPATLNTLTILDADGPHEVQIQQLPSLTIARSVQAVTSAIERLGGVLIEAEKDDGENVRYFSVGASIVVISADALTVNLAGPPELLDQIVAFDGEQG